ncbi:MAG: hypothetical protein JRK26_25265 [Deltaproteobacteria bacterium]|nr:hypothetical protein [Deltaproteobacteria bacterium]MBW1962401.1 hypothetical protein [Deltaproteobacteria bacterium]
MKDARQVVEHSVTYYNTERLHSAIGYITHKDKLKGREFGMFAARDRKLEKARELRMQSQYEVERFIKKQSGGTISVSV